MVKVIVGVLILVIVAVVAVFVYRNNKKKVLAAADAAVGIADKVVSAEEKAKELANKLKK